MARCDRHRPRSDRVRTSAAVPFYVAGRCCSKERHRMLLGCRTAVTARTDRPLGRPPE